MSFMSSLWKKFAYNGLLYVVSLHKRKPHLFCNGGFPPHLPSRSIVPLIILYMNFNAHGNNWLQYSCCSVCPTEKSTLSVSVNSPPPPHHAPLISSLSLRASLTWQTLVLHAGFTSNYPKAQQNASGTNDFTESIKARTASWYHCPLRLHTK